MKLLSMLKTAFQKVCATFKRKTYKVSVLQADNGEWYYRVTAGNGRIVCHSETYPEKRIADDEASQLCNARIVVSDCP